MSTPIDLYTLLPEVYRREDARRGYPLKALLAIISEQANIVREDIDRLWDNFFVETAGDWVLPYIGDLVGNTPIHNAVGGRRADIAKTIYYRLRKGTLPMLEELARDVTGWSVHAVAFFDLLTWTQNMNHLRPNVGTIHLRDIDLCDRAHTPFDGASHNVDLRPFDSAAGWHHIKKVGFFIWRLGSYELTRVQPRPAAANSFGYFFNPLGIEQHLFNTPAAESDETGLAGEIHVAGPIRKIAFHDHPEQYFGPTGSVGLIVDGDEKTAEDIVCMDLSTWQQRSDGKIGVDVVNGRFALPDGMSATAIEASLQYGFSADVGGGSYERRDDETVRDPEFWVRRNPDEPGDVVYLPTDFDTIGAALAAWDVASTPRLVIHIEDSRTYDEDLTFDQNAAGAENVQVIIQAANKTRPMLAGNLTVAAGGSPARLSLKGLLIEGTITVEADCGLALLEVLHCTLVPGVALDESLEPQQPATASIEVGANNDLLDVVLDGTISGPLRLPPDTRSLWIGESIVDSVDAASLGRHFPALASGGLVLADANTAAGQELTVQMGDETHSVRFDWSGAGGIAGIAQALEDALQGVPGATEAFARAQVLSHGPSRRVMIVPGVPRRVRVGDGEAAQLLALAPGRAVEMTITVGAPVGDLSALPATPQLAVVAETGAADAVTAQRFDISLSPADSSPAALAAALQTELRAVLGPLTFVQEHESGRLAVYSLEPGLTVRLLAHPADPLSVRLLGLMSSLPAIGYDAAGLIPGPETTIEASTLIGPVIVRAMQMASNTIFTDTVSCQRRQIGCIRFSYVPPASTTPRRYRCQPDRAMEAAETDEAAAAAARRIRPDFTTRRYGQPAYAQLSLDCAEEISTGADNGAEMGVFNSLMQPQRAANLRIRFEEYLPFGLEAGLIFIN